jgi:hypothetical protein
MACEAASISHPHRRFGPARGNRNRGTLNGGFSTCTAVSGVSLSRELHNNTVVIAEVRYGNKR